MNDFLKLKGKMLSLVCLFFILSSSFAQVVVMPHPIVGFQASSKDILNFDILYSSNQPVNVQFEAQLNDASGRNVVRFMSAVHTLKSGSNSFNPTSFNITSTKYFNQDISRIESYTKFLPSGNYSYCIFIRCVDQEEICRKVLNPENDHSACSDFTVEPTTPLLLNYPDDEAKLEITENRPNFNWIPPMPMGSDPNIRYTFTLVKMLDKQTPEDAIRRNRSLYKQSEINGISLMFPNQLEDLEVGAHYAWQVSAQIGKLQIATSEVWEFEIEVVVTAHQYVKAETKLNMSYINLYADTLIIAVDEYLSHEYVAERNIQILNAQRQTVWSSKEDKNFYSIQVLGTNRILIETCLIFNGLVEETYIIQIQTDSGLRYVRIKNKLVCRE